MYEFICLHIQLLQTSSKPDSQQPEPASENARYTRALEAELVALRQTVDNDYKIVVEANEELRAILTQYHLERSSTVQVPLKAVPAYFGFALFILTCATAFVVVCFQGDLDSVFDLPMLLPNLFVSLGLCLFSGSGILSDAASGTKSVGEQAVTTEEIRAADLAAEAMVIGAGNDEKEETTEEGKDSETKEQGEQPSSADAAGLEHLDSLYEKKDFDELHKSLKKEIAESGGIMSAPVPLLWRFCRVAGELEELGGNGSEELIFKALDATDAMLSRETVRCWIMPSLREACTPRFLSYYSYPFSSIFSPPLSRFIYR